MDSVLVTGGEGFIGRYVRASLAANGANVVCLDSKPHSSSGHYCYQGDITNPEQIAQAFTAHPISTVVHLASCLRTASIENPQKATQVNVLGTLNILEAARKAGVRRFMYGSSSSVYGSPLNDHDTSEDVPPRPEDMYGASKRYAEILGEGYARNYGMEFIAIRIPVVIGPGATQTSSPWRSQIFELTSTQGSDIRIPFKGDQALTLVHVEDLGDEIAQLVRARSLSFTCYNAPGETWTLGDLKKEIEKLNRNLAVHFGHATVSGFAARMDSKRFESEFHYSPKPLKARLADAAMANRS